MRPIGVAADSDLAGVSDAGICAGSTPAVAEIQRFVRRYGAPPLRERLRGDATAGRHRCLLRWHLQQQ
jgi:hypothetical protein